MTMVIILHELKWLPLCLTQRPKTKFQRVRNCCLDGKSGGKPFYHPKQNDKQRHKPKKERGLAENCGCRERSRSCKSHSRRNTRKMEKIYISKRRKNSQYYRRSRKKQVVGQFQRCRRLLRLRLLTCLKIHLPLLALTVLNRKVGIFLHH